MTARASVAERRIAIAASGALAGVATWVLVDILPDAVGDARLRLAIAAGLAGFFIAVFATLGPLRTPLALLSGLIVGVPAAILMPTASLRFENVGDFLESVHPVAALVLMIALPIPYLLAGLGRRRDAFRYETLFDAAWQMVVRASAALVFVALFWALVFLSNLLFGLVGLDLIESLLDIDAMPYILTGAAFGLALAVAHEMSDYVSPHLPLRLLRLLLPLVMGVTAVFLAVLPFRGLSGLFGDFSAAATLMTLSLAAMTLVSAALDRNDDAAVRGFLLRSAAAMAMLLPVMALLAVLAVAERVGQYGWTPDRLAAMTVAGLLSLYGFAYLAAVLRRRNWMGRIRRANAIMALVVIAAALLWMSPLVNPQRIAATSQVERFRSGLVAAGGLDLWTIANEWGRPGKAAIAILAEAGDPELSERLSALAAAESRYDFEVAAPPATIASDIRAVSEIIVIRPEGATLPEGTLESRAPGEAERWREACDRRTPGGNPGCAALVADLVPSSPGDEVVLFMMLSESFVQIVPVFESDRLEGARPYREAHPISGDLSAFTRAGVIDRLVAGEIDVVSRPLNVLSSQDGDLVVLP